MGVWRENLLARAVARRLAINAGGHGGDRAVGVEDVDLAVDKRLRVGLEVARRNGSGHLPGPGHFHHACSQDGAHDAAGDDDVGGLEDAGEAGIGFDEDAAAGADACEGGIAADDDILEAEVFVAVGAAGVDGTHGDAEGLAAEGAVEFACGGGVAGFGALGDGIPVHEG